jgi:pSer/pThr/pTyr-binding forkhead associated (FHA) protein
LSKYNKLAYYISRYTDIPLDEFLDKNPNGFFVERSERLYDENVMFQFFTEVVDDQYVIEQLKSGDMQADILNSRVIEIKKKKSAADSEHIKIGRSPDSDIVLYNKLVSKNHALLYPNPSSKTCYLVDKGSTNGTFVNGKSIAPNSQYKLTNVDEISFGPETKVIYLSSELFHSMLLKVKAI